MKSNFFKTIIFLGLSIALPLFFMSCGKKGNDVSSAGKGQGLELLQNEKDEPNPPGTIVDTVGNVIKVNQPAKRIVVSYYGAAEILRSLGVAHRVVGIGETIQLRKTFFPRLGKLPCFGLPSSNSKVIEKILSLKPDLVILRTRANDNQTREKLHEINPNLCVVQMDFYKPDRYFKEITKIGKILNREQAAKKYLNFINSILDEIKATVRLNNNKKPRVYFESTQDYKTGAKGSSWDPKIKMAGGINLFTDEPVALPKVTSESIMKKRPDVIIKTSGWNMLDFGGYKLDDYTKIKMIHGELMNRSAWNQMKAVKNNNVWVFYNDILGGPSFFIGVTYMAKIFYPKSTKELNPLKIHQRYLREFQHLDFDVSRHGVFVYPKVK